MSSGLSIDQPLLPVAPGTPEEHDAAVRSVLRWCRDKGYGVEDVETICAALGLDLDVAVGQAS